MQVLHLLVGVTGHSLHIRIAGNRTAPMHDQVSHERLKQAASEGQDLRHTI